MTGSEIAVKDEETGLAPISDAEAQLAQGIKSRIDQSKITLPALKVLNGTSSDVGDDLQVGDLINSVTRENYGDSVEVAVCGVFEGYFLSINDGDDSFVARGDVVPSNWPEEYAGKRFSELPDTEDNYKAACNDPDNPQEWGEGPPISTTHNFVVITAEEPGLPLRLSLMRSNTKTANKLYTLLAAARVPWDKTIIVEAEQRSRATGNSKYWGFSVRQGNPVSDELRAEAVKTAQGFQEAEARGAVELAGDEPEEKPAKPEARKGGLGVG